MARHNMTITLPTSLYEAVVRHRGYVQVSKVCEEALREKLRDLASELRTTADYLEAEMRDV